MLFLLANFHSGDGKRHSRTNSVSFAPLHHTIHHSHSHNSYSTGDRPFFCPLEHCSKSFTDKSGQRRHAKTHLAPSPVPAKRYECRQCPKTYKELKYLDVHIRSAHFDRLSELVYPTPGAEVESIERFQRLREGPPSPESEKEEEEEDVEMMEISESLLMLGTPSSLQSSPPITKRHSPVRPHDTPLRAISPIETRYRTPSPNELNRPSPPPVRPSRPLDASLRHHNASTPSPIWNYRTTIARSTSPYAIPLLQPPIRRTVSAEGVVSSPLIGLGLSLPNGEALGGAEGMVKVARRLDYGARVKVKSVPAKRGPLNSSIVLC